MVFAFSRLYIEDIEHRVSGTLNAIREAPSMTQSCRKYAIRALCYHIFNTCDPKIIDVKPKLCREDCFALYDNVCHTELALIRSDPSGVGRLLPNCSHLPTKAQEDHKFCTSMGITKGVYALKEICWGSCVVKDKNEKERETRTISLSFSFNFCLFVTT